MFIRVISWIVLFGGVKVTIHEITPTDTKYPLTTSYELLTTRIQIAKAIKLLTKLIMSPAKKSATATTNPNTITRA